MRPTNLYPCPLPPNLYRAPNPQLLYLLPPMTITNSFIVILLRLKLFNLPPLESLCIQSDLLLLFRLLNNLMSQSLNRFLVITSLLVLFFVRQCRLRTEIPFFIDHSYSGTNMCRPNLISYRQTLRLLFHS